MKIRTYTRILLLFSVLVASCAAGGNEASPGVSGEIVCEVFYRPTAGQGLEAAPFATFTSGNDRQERQFQDMTFEASFQDDEFEGRALSIVVADLDSGEEIARQLYQFDLQHPVENQFIGGHGFTGLVYVFHPTSAAEMQYFCHVA